MRISTLGRLALGLSLTTAGLFAGSAYAQSTDATPVTGGTAILALGSEPSNLNPDVSTNNPDLVAGCMIYQGLVEISDQGEVLPLLAKSWTVSDDGLTYDFQLNDVKWSDGQPFTADDVVYSLPNVSAKYAPLFSAQVGKKLASVEAVGPHEVKVTLNSPFGPFLRMLSCSNGGSIMPAHLYKDSDVMTNATTTTTPVGTGPFVLTEWRRGDYLRFERNPNYWEPGKPYLDGLVIKVIPDSAARTQALLSGEVDFIGSYFLAASDIATLKSNPNVRLEVEGGPPNMLLGFLNLAEKPLSDVNVRKALMTAIDRHYIQQTAFSGSGLPGTEPFPVQLPWVVNPDIDYDKMYGFDPAKAAKMLDDAGYPVGADGTRFKIRIAYESGIAERDQAAAAIQDMWKQIGVAAVLEPTEQAILLPKLYKDKDFDMAIMSYSTYADPAIGIARAFVSTTIGQNFGNGSAYSNPQVDELFKEGGEASDLAARTAAYQKVQAIIADELPNFTLHSNKSYDAVSAKLFGVWGTEGNGRWSDAWLAQ